MARVEVQGIEPLVATLKENVTLNDVKRVVQKNGADLTRQMKRQTSISYVKGYSLGDTAGSINLKMENNGMSAVVTASTDYVEYVEKGTRFMSPEPIAQPSLDVIAPRFISDLKRLTK